MIVNVAELAQPTAAATDVGGWHLSKRVALETLIRVYATAPSQVSKERRGSGSAGGPPLRRRCKGLVARPRLWWPRPRWLGRCQRSG
jgi:hypothetical protein